jgi:hypothetical protein
MKNSPNFLLTTGQFLFDPVTKTLRGYSESFAGGFPPSFKVKSDHTGKIVEFKHIGPEHSLFDEDHWDGEQAIYEPTEPQQNVKLCVITHAY